MQKFHLVCFFALLTLGLGGAFRAPAQAPAFQWVTAGHATNYQGRGGVYIPSGMALDESGNVYTGLSMTGNVTIGTTLITVAPGDTIAHTYLVKFSPLGNLVWKKEMPIVEAVTTDSAGNVYAAGQFEGLTATVDNQAVVGVNVGPNNSPNYYLAKWAPNGQILWAVAGGATGSCSIFDLKLTPRGEPVMSGSFNGTLLAAPVTAVGNPTGSFCGFCLKFSSTGVPQWVVSSLATSPGGVCLGERVDVDRFGKVHFIGTYLDAIAIGGLPALPPAPRIIAGSRSGGGTFHVTISPTGQALTQQAYSSDTTAYQQRAGMDPDGFMYLTTSFKGHYPLHGGATLQSTGTNYNTLIARYDPTGALQWVKQIGGLIEHDLIEPTNLRASRQGRLYITGAMRGIVTVDGFTLSYQPPTGNRIGGFGFYAMALDQQTGTPLWATIGQSRAYSTGFTMDVNNRGEVAIGGYLQGDTARFGSIRIGQPTDPWIAAKSLIIKIRPEYNTLHGTAFVDANRDGQLTAGEAAFTGGALVRVRQGVPAAYTDSLYVTTDPRGQYDATVVLGTYAATVVPPRYYQATNTPPAPATFSSYGNISAQNLPLRAIPGQQDLVIHVTPFSRARPGFVVRYRVTYTNPGTVALPTGTLRLTYDPLLTYLSTTLPGAAQSGNGLTGSFANLQPGQTRTFDVLFQLATTAPLGTVLQATADIGPLAGDLTPADNTETSRLTVTGSLDPNDIAVNHTSLTAAQVATGEWLEYTIRFRNLGTDTAFTVLLRDSLPVAQLNLGTLQLLSVSHSCQWGLRPGGVLTISFTSAKLPPYRTNTIAADGFVRFRVRPATALVPGDQVPNRAVIHFDYNAPLTTNTALTAINQPTGLPGESSSNGAFDLAVWPNPATGTLHVEARAPEAGPLTLTLLDALGRPALTQTGQATPGTTRRTATLDLNGLPAGLYVLRGTGAGAAFTRRVVVR